MTISVVGVTSASKVTPYLTPDMFKTHSRAGVQVENLVPGGDPAQQDAALMMYIEEGAAWIDTQAEMPNGFSATLDMQSGLVNVDRNGFATIIPRKVPCIGVTSFAIGGLPSQLTPLGSLTGAIVLPGQIRLPIYPLATLTSSQGPIQFGGVPAPSDQAYYQAMVCAGYPVTTLTEDVAAGATVLNVADTTGIVEGQTWLTVYALAGRFRFLAGAVSTADAGGLGTGPGTVACSAAPANISNSANYPIQVSAIPQNLILANVLATRAFIKQKGSGSVSATSATTRSTKEGRQNAGDDLAEAWGLIDKLLNPVGS